MYKICNMLQVFEYRDLVFWIFQWTFLLWWMECHIKKISLKFPLVKSPKNPIVTFLYNVKDIDLIFLYQMASLTRRRQTTRLQVRGWPRSPANRRRDRNRVAGARPVQIDRTAEQRLWWALCGSLPRGQCWRWGCAHGVGRAVQFLPPGEEDWRRAAVPHLLHAPAKIIVQVSAVQTLEKRSFLLCN